jgi:hypothetical protein
VQKEHYGGLLDTPTRRLFYLFNITNLNDVLWGRSRPVLQEVGPYVYTVIASKYDVRFGVADGSPYVSYKVYTRLEFDKTWSMGLEESDQITTVNLPYKQVLVKLKESGLTESYLSSSYAHDAYLDYKGFLLGDEPKELEELEGGSASARRRATTATDAAHNTGTSNSNSASSGLGGARVLSSRVLSSSVGDQGEVTVSDPFEPMPIKNFLAHEKRRSLSRYLTGLYAEMRLQQVPATLGTLVPELHTRTVPSVLNRLYGKVHGSIVAWQYGM